MAKYLMRTILLLVLSFTYRLSMGCCGSSSVDITYTALSETNYRIEVFATTCLSSPSDLPGILVTVDGGEQLSVPRMDIQDVPTLDVRRSTYRFEHDFLEAGWHTIHASVGYRGSGIVNIPNSIAQSLCVEAMFIAGPSEAMNNGMRFSMPPYSIEIIGDAWVHDPGVLETDGDSLSIEWVVPGGFSCQPILGYEFPEATVSASVEPASGTFTWQSPPFPGSFNLTLRGSEFRDGELIGKVTRDMILCVTNTGIGMQEDLMAGRLELTPSITDGPVRIRGNWSISGSLQVFDVTGKVLMQGISQEAPTILDLSPLPSGPYLVRVVAKDGSVYTGTVVRR